MKPPFFVLREGGFSLAGGALLGAHGAGVAAGFTPLPLRERLDEGWVSVAPQGLLGWQPLCFTAAFRLKASYFLLLAQKKVSKEKGTPLARLATPTPLRYSPGRAAAELGPSALKQSSPTTPGLSALLTAPDGGPGKASRFLGSAANLLFSPIFTVNRKITRHSRESGNPPAVAPKWIPACAGMTDKLRRLSGPIGRCRATEKLADKGRGLFEARRAEFRSPRRFRVAQGTGRSPAPYGGRLFFAYFLLAKQKKVRRAASAKPTVKPSNTTSTYKQTHNQ